jgi:hypothetical protein
VCVCVCVCIYIYIYIYIYTHTHTHTYVRTYIHVYIHARTHTRTQARTHTHARTHARTRTVSHTHILSQTDAESRVTIWYQNVKSAHITQVCAIMSNKCDHCVLSAHTISMSAIHQMSFNHLRLRSQLSYFFQSPVTQTAINKIFFKFLLGKKQHTRQKHCKVYSLVLYSK